ncbi:patatin-like phospholipase family protein [Subtercola sp. YIM 133946]|uniref:patatin-like phospholipase family protein n=1 Tax=Subtercola sp. YIM 133946 TaxID=3118909 RepID=UPI002F94B439
MHATPFTTFHVSLLGPEAERRIEYVALGDGGGVHERTREHEYAHEHERAREPELGREPELAHEHERTREPELARERALVLGGGGAAGNAWLIGVIAGLADGGLDVTEAADLVVGTSAGATAAAQLAGEAPRRLYADILSATSPQRHGGAQPGARPSAQPGPHPGQPGALPGDLLGQPGAQPRDLLGQPGARRSAQLAEQPGAQPTPQHGPLGPMTDHLRRTNDVIAAAEGPADVRRRLGASALALDDAHDRERQAAWRTTVAGRLTSRVWPPRPRASVLISAVDARTGAAVVFDRDSGVDLVDAVAASTAGGPPYDIGGIAYIDGGYRRSSENADLAAGFRRVLVLSPLGGRTRMPLEWNMHLAAQVDELRAGGSEVATILPDDASLDAFGPSMMNLSARPAAARAGFAQGRSRAAELAAFWH